MKQLETVREDFRRTWCLTSVIKESQKYPYQTEKKIDNEHFKQKKRQVAGVKPQKKDDVLCQMKEGEVKQA
jgi:hypothetical protein